MENEFKATDTDVHEADVDGVKEQVKTDSSNISKESEDGTKDYVEVDYDVTITPRKRKNDEGVALAEGSSKVKMMKFKAVKIEKD